APAAHCTASGRVSAKPSSCASWASFRTAKSGWRAGSTKPQRASACRERSRSSEKPLESGSNEVMTDQTNQTSRCAEVEERMADILDGSAPDDLLDHIADCDVCRDARHDAEELAAL